MGLITEFRLFTVACLVLAIGGAVYLLERPPGTASLIPIWLSSFQPQLASSWLSQSLPSLCHVFGFAVLTTCALRPWQGALAFSCLFWVVVNILFELGQINLVASEVIPRFPAWLNQWPILSDIDAYLAAGIFDPIDIAFIVLGGLGAYVTVLVASQEGGDSC
jgi:hypothetical protein